MKEPKYWSYQEAAERIGIPVGTLYAKVAKKEIPHVRLGRRHVLFPVDELLKWIDSHNVTLSHTHTAIADKPSDGSPKRK